jgi:hypothetical protein
MKKIWHGLTRLAFVALVLVSSYLASGLFYVAPDEIVLMGYRRDADRVIPFAYIAEEGWYLGDPFAEYVTMRIGFEKPTTADYIEAAIMVDRQRDVWAKAQGPRNPRSKEELMVMVQTVATYINKRTEEIGRPVALDKVEFFEPDKMSGRFDEEIAHYDYLARTMRINMAHMRAMQREEDDSMLMVVTHELAHSALNVFTGEQLCQLLTLQVLYDMKEGGVPGAGFAFWDELRSWFLAAARWRIEFNHGVRIIDLETSAEVEDHLRTIRQDMPRTWATRKESLEVTDNLRGLLNLLKGNPYQSNRVLVESSPTASLAIKLIEARYNVRAKGWKIRPGRWLYERGVPVSLLRKVFGATYAHRTITLISGEKEFVDKWIRKLRQGETVHWKEYREKLRNDPGYFAATWWGYLYGPLQLLEAHQFGNNPVRYWVLELDINEMSYWDWMALVYFGKGIAEKQMQFEDVGPLIHKLLNLKPSPIVVQDDDRLWQRPIYHLYEPTSVPFKPFPLSPLIAVLAVIFERRLRRGYRVINARLMELWRAFGCEISL